MKTLTLLLSLLLAGTAAAQHPDHTAVVAQVKADLVARGFDLSSPGDTKPCNVFAITRRVAWILKDEGIGYVKKGGNNCEGHSVDALMYRDGTVIDTLISSGEANTPAWNNVGTRPLTDWEAPTDPGDTGGQPPQPPSDLQRRVESLEQRIVATDQRVAVLDNAVSSLRDAVAQAKADVSNVSGAIAAFENRLKALEARPTVTGCKASIRLGVGGIPIACEVTR